ncbi:MAG: hypothetical protein GC151_04240 [Betaproteobacteria bacterium]|nr:hypothetical protein [Betaproteobacteria bacterium]
MSLATRILPGIAAVLLLLSLSPAMAVEQESDLPPATNALERMHLKHAKCVWTQEIGDYIYQCLKANFGMNAHWCHNEAMEVLCPKQLEAARADAPATPDARKE